MQGKRLQRRKRRDECGPMPCGEFGKPGPDEGGPGIPVREDSRRACGCDGDPDGAAVGWVGFANGETGILESIDEGRHAGLRELLEVREFRDPQAAERVESAEGAQRARGETRRLAGLPEPTDNGCERLRYSEIIGFGGFHLSII
jgi:hypothetical protein